MAMDWLKGLVGAPAQFVQPGQPIPGSGAGWSPQSAPGWSPGPSGTPYVGPPAGAAAPAAVDPRILALETRCDALRHDVEALALFARTLLTVMVERQVLTQEQFVEAKQKLDLLDGKLDDRVAAGVPGT